MPLDAPRRRPFLLQPGESLLIPTSAGAALARTSEMARLTGLADSSSLVTTTSAAIPLPVYRDDYAQTNDRLPEWDSSLLWHPLMWLPRDFALRYLLVDDDETSAAEPDELWAVRVCLTLQEHGLYDPTSGTWLDILSAFGLDIDDAQDQARINAWIAGAPDDTLDSIEADVEALLAGQTGEEIPDWPLRAALAVSDDVLVTSWGTLAMSLKQDFDMLTAPLVEGTVDSVAEVAEDLSAVATMAQALLGAVPVSVTLRGQEPDDDSAPVSGEYWAELSERLAAADERVSEAVDELDAALSRIVEFSGPYRQSLYDFDDQVALAQEALEAEAITSQDRDSETADGLPQLESAGAPPRPTQDAGAPESTGGAP